MRRHSQTVFSLRLGGSLLLAALALGSSQLRCADANNYIVDDADDPGMTGDGGTKGDMAEGPCFMGTPMTDVQFFNRCTDAERIERGSHIPATTWDGQSPLPYQK